MLDEGQGVAVEAWHDYFVALTGAAAALVGLVFVGVSINLDRILHTAHLPGRALMALLRLMLILLLSSLALVPAQGLFALGAEWFGLTGASAVWFAFIQRGVWRLSSAEIHPRLLGQTVLAQAALLFLVIAGLLLLLGNAVGLYWGVPGLLLCFVCAALDAWVLLVEVNR